MDKNNLSKIVTRFCNSCSNDGSVFRQDFDDARYGDIKNKQTISTTPAPDVGRPFNM